MVGCQVLIAQMDPIQRNGFYLIVTDRQQRPVAANQEAVDTNRVDQRNNRGVLDPAEAPPLKVIDLEAEQLGEEVEFVRHVPGFLLPGST